MKQNTHTHTQFPHLILTLLQPKAQILTNHGRVRFFAALDAETRPAGTLDVSYACFGYGYHGAVCSGAPAGVFV